jgi:type IV pilus assembly protein PilA
VSNWFRKSMAKKDEGFTLIELLVVMIIIGILAAIAIPVFLNQRKKAVDTSIKADLRTVATEMETYYTDNQSYSFTSGSTVTPTVSRVVTISTGQAITVSVGNVITATPLLTAIGKDTAFAASTKGFCITGVNAKGSNAGWTYNSLGGGISTTACPTT